MIKIETNKMNTTHVIINLTINIRKFKLMENYEILGLIGKGKFN